MIKNHIESQCFLRVELDSQLLTQGDEVFIQ